MPRKIAKGMSVPQRALDGYSLSAEKKAEYDEQYENRRAKKRAESAQQRLEAQGFSFDNMRSYIKNLRG